MSTNLVPIAVSSQLDITGEEKIHAAPFPLANVSNRLAWLGITGDLPDGYQGAADVGLYTILQGVAPYTVSLVSGSFPAGLTLTSAGTWSGTRTTPGTYSWQAKVVDAQNVEAFIDDTSETFSLTVNNWTTKPDSLAQTHICAAIIDTTIAIGANNNTLTYSTDQGATWTVLSGSAQTGLANAGAAVGNIIRFNDDWYLFNNVANMSKDTGGDLVFSAVSNAPSACDRSVTILNNELYCGVSNNGGGANIILRKMVTPGSIWTTIDTGIAQLDGTDTINTMCEVNGGEAYLFGTGRGRILRSTDLITFTQVHSGAANITTSAAIGNVVLMADQSGTYLRSADAGLTWNSIASPQVISVAANGYIFICSGIHQISIGTDGQSWTQVYDGTFEPGTQNNWPAANLDLAVVTRFSSYAVVGTT